MLEVLKPIAASFATTNYVLALCLEQIDDTDARKRVRNGEGPSIAWQVGHMLDHRCKVLGLLGVKKANPYDSKYTASCASDGSDYPAMADLRHEWEQLYAELQPALEAASTESLGQMVERGVHGPRTVLDSTLFLIWHEAYHTGALASICKELGYQGPAELAIAKATATA
jgi:uncharacterized damage-inducible protein DinB